MTGKGDQATPARNKSRVFTLDMPMVDGCGTVRIDDSGWRVSGPDAAVFLERIYTSRERRGQSSSAASPSMAIARKRP